MLLGYRTVVCVTRNNLYRDDEIFPSSPPTQDRIAPTDTGTNPMNRNTLGTKKNPFPTTIHLQLPTIL